MILDFYPPKLWKIQIFFLINYPSLVDFVKATENGIRPETTPNDGLDLPFLCYNLIINNKGRIHPHSRDVN